MSLSDPFIHRPVGTTLLVIALALAGALAYRFLPVSPLPQVEFPTISVSASLPGASPETMASSVATPLERQFGRIAGVTEMTSSSSLGSTSITLQFELSRNIDAAGRDVQAAINAALGQLPSNLPGRPNYRKVNPADAPVMILALTSGTYGTARMYDAAATILQQKLAQVEGVGQVTVGGGALPAVRVDVNPTALNAMGLALSDVRTALASANANRPKGSLSDERREWALSTTDQLLKAREYQPLIIAYKDGAGVRLSDVARVSDGVEDVRTGGLANGEPAVSLVIFRQPGANIIDTVERVKAILPELRASIPAAMKLDVLLDRTTTIRASVADVEKTLLISIALVILVVFAFLRDPRATLIPSVAVPISLVGTFAVMYLAGYSIDNLSLMALTIATGFVVDDAIVVIENITRYLEQGLPPFEAALRGAREIGFTVLSMSTSLIAVFIPILLMGGIVGRLFREFAVVLSVAIGISMAVSLTATPMMCAYLLQPHGVARHGRVYMAAERVFDALHAFYTRTLDWVLGHQRLMLAVTLATVGLTAWLYVVVPKGFFPQQDTGRLMGSIVADQDTSSQSMQKLMQNLARTTLEDPAVEGLVGFTGGQGGTSNTGRMFVTLKPLAQRRIGADQVIGRLRGRLAAIPGATLYLQPVQDLRIGGRLSAAQFQYTLQGDDLKELGEWAPRITSAMATLPGLTDVSSDQQVHGLESDVQIDRETAARLGVSSQLIDDALYDAFGQRQVSTTYTPLNQYHVVMEVDPRLAQDPDALNEVRVRPPNHAPVPLSAFARYGSSATPLSVSHQSLFPAITISFNLKPGIALGEAVERIRDLSRSIAVPASIHGSFTGTAQAFQDSLANEPLLVAAAILAVYIVLGMLYESLVHPLTILSTLPSAGVGALLALLACGVDLSVMALIGIILLIGIVKKNAILMIDFALVHERETGCSPAEAIRKACLLRFRPISMTTMCALLGGLPLALGTGVGSELRRPLGIAIVGGLVFSQILTLYTTPVVYLFLDRVRKRLSRSPSGGALRVAAALAIPLCFCFGGCRVGPDYHARELPTTPAFESVRAGDAAESGEPALDTSWWTLFEDPQLAQLESAALEHNQDLLAAAARVVQARALARVAGSQSAPTLAFAPSYLHGRGVVAGGSATTTQVHVPFDAAYEVDVWGRVSRSREAADAGMLASAADFGVVRLTLCADVAQAWFTLRSLDAQIEILTRSIGLFEKQVELTTTQQRAGLVGQTDVSQAQTQLETARAQLSDVRRQRADEEHALAILAGEAPAQLTLPAQILAGVPPTVPPGLPAELLRRRPDVASAEQALIAANASIGVAQANFYPTLSLSGSAGWESFDVNHALDWENRVWSVGAGLVAPIFEGGKLTAELEQAKARYDELLATYRGTVLTAYREVEDALTDMHLHAESAEAESRAVASARESVRLAQIQYSQGLVGYLQVLDAERTLLGAELTLEGIQDQRFAASVSLIKALGGGWTPAQADEDARTQSAVGPR